jgi:hypothetical protein
MLVGYRRNGWNNRLNRQQPAADIPNKELTR